jgi:hypothetical protein
MYSSQQSAYTDLGLNDAELKQLIPKMPGGNNTKIRVRVKYDLVKAITGQVYGPWRYISNTSYGSNTGPLGKYWNGNVSNVWSNNLNWNGLVVPTINDDVFIPNTANHMPTVYTSTTIKSLKLL